MRSQLTVHCSLLTALYLCLAPYARAADNDGDGYAFPEDCNDSSYRIHPGATEICDANGIDDNCDGRLNRVSLTTLRTDEAPHVAFQQGYPLRPRVALTQGFGRLAIAFTEYLEVEDRRRVRINRFETDFTPLDGGAGLGLAYSNRNSLPAGIGFLFHTTDAGDTIARWAVVGHSAETDQELFLQRVPFYPRPLGGADPEAPISILPPPELQAVTTELVLADIQVAVLNGRIGIVAIFESATDYDNHVVFYLLDYDGSPVMTRYFGAFPVLPSFVRIAVDAFTQNFVVAFSLWRRWPQDHPYGEIHVWAIAQTGETNSFTVPASLMTEAFGMAARGGKVYFAKDGSSDDDAFWCGITLASYDAATGVHLATGHVQAPPTYHCSMPELQAAESELAVAFVTFEGDLISREGRYGVAQARFTFDLAQIFLGEDAAGIFEHEVDDDLFFPTPDWTTPPHGNRVGFISSTAAADGMFVVVEQVDELASDPPTSLVSDLYLARSYDCVAENAGTPADLAVSDFEVSQGWFDTFSLDLGPQIHIAPAAGRPTLLRVAAYVEGAAGGDPPTPYTGNAVATYGGSSVSLVRFATPRDWGLPLATTPNSEFAWDLSHQLVFRVPAQMAQDGLSIEIEVAPLNGDDPDWTNNTTTITPTFAEIPTLEVVAVPIWYKRSAESCETDEDCRADGCTYDDDGMGECATCRTGDFEGKLCLGDDAVGEFEFELRPNEEEMMRLFELAVPVFPLQEFEIIKGTELLVDKIDFSQLRVDDGQGGWISSTHAVHVALTSRYKQEERLTETGFLHRLYVGVYPFTSLTQTLYKRPVAAGFQVPAYNSATFAIVQLPPNRKVAPIASVGSTRSVYTLVHELAHLLGGRDEILRHYTNDTYPYFLGLPRYSPGGWIVRADAPIPQPNEEWSDITSSYPWFDGSIPVAPRDERFYALLKGDETNLSLHEGHRYCVVDHWLADKTRNGLLLDPNREDPKAPGTLLVFGRNPDGSTAVAHPPLFFDSIETAYDPAPSELVAKIFDTEGASLAEFGMTFSPIVDSDEPVGITWAVIPEVHAAHVLHVEDAAGTVVASWPALEAPAVGPIDYVWIDPTHLTLTWSCVGTSSHFRDSIEYGASSEWSIVNEEWGPEECQATFGIDQLEQAADCTFRVLRSGFQDIEIATLPAGDLDGDGIGDPCDPDADGDDILDFEDPCVSTADRVEIVDVEYEPRCLWPPDHRMVPFLFEQNLRVVVDAECPDFVDVSVLGIQSSEPDNAEGDGDTTGDTVFGASGFCLRAERRGGGAGRSYDVELQATSVTGETDRATVTILVPHDLGDPFLRETCEVQTTNIPGASVCSSLDSDGQLANDGTSPGCGATSPVWLTAFVVFGIAARRRRRAQKKRGKCNRGRLAP